MNQAELEFHWQNKWDKFQKKTHKVETYLFKKKKLQLKSDL